MLGFRIFTHSAKLVFSNFAAAMKLSGWPYLAVYALLIGVIAAYFDNVSDYQMLMAGQAVCGMSVPVILVAMNIALSKFVFSGFVGLAMAFAVNWVVLIVGVSVLTTLYGLAVEGRSLR